MASGEQFKADQICQVGWSVVQVRNSDDGNLTLWEPDMQGFPIRWVDSVSRTLAHVRLQKDVCESVSSSGELFFPSMRQFAIVCSRLGRTPGFLMERAAPSGLDSGWFCGCTGNDHDQNDVGELKRVSLYEAAVHYTAEIVPYLALPNGVLVKSGESSLLIFWNGKRMGFKPGSYLAERHKAVR